MSILEILRARARVAVVLAAAVAMLAGCAPAVPPEAPPAQSTPSRTPSSVRAVWVTYIELDALLSGTADEAATALSSLFDRLASLGINTVFFHVRAHSDALYSSAEFAAAPWVQPLLDAGFDPLQYAVEQAHARQMELHAWVNPYRIGTDPAAAVCDDVFLQNGVYYYIPSSSAVQTCLLDGIRELLTGYAVDGIHFDDYFYPPGAVGDTEAAAFEQEAFSAYTAAGGTASVADWRRLQVDRLVAAVCRLAHAHGRVFGISPAANLSRCREVLYADVGKWMSTPGYIDYICPQIYFGFENGVSPFEQALSEWSSYPRAPGVKLYVGLAAYKAGLLHDTYAGTGQSEWANGGDILARQIRLLQTSAAVSGFALYASSYLFTQTHTGAVGSPLYDPQVLQAELESLYRILRESNS